MKCRIKSWWQEQSRSVIEGAKLTATLYHLIFCIGACYQNEEANDNLGSVASIITLFNLNIHQKYGASIHY